MPVVLQHCRELPLTLDEVARLWGAVVTHQDHADDHVTVRCVGETEMRRLNAQYRRNDKPTNVLTFSYPSIHLHQGYGGQANSEHDVALCMALAQREAAEGGALLRDWAALLLVHAFLHACGLDHEVSAQAARTMRAAEETVLVQLGFVVPGWR